MQELRQPMNKEKRSLNLFVVPKAKLNLKIGSDIYEMEKNAYSFFA